ncbi:hypothetical protein DSECCO2_573950 [anaerobic digester metagenome]
MQCINGPAYNPFDARLFQQGGGHYRSPEIFTDGDHGIITFPEWQRLHGQLIGTIETDGLGDYFLESLSLHLAAVNTDHFMSHVRKLYGQG